MISKKAVLLGGLSLLIGTASVAAAKEAICSGTNNAYSPYRAKAA